MRVPIAVPSFLDVMFLGKFEDIVFEYEFR